MSNLFAKRNTGNLRHLFDAQPLMEVAEPPRTDIYPKYEAWVVRMQDGSRVLDRMPWGSRTMPSKSGKPIQDDNDSSGSS